MIIIAVDDEKIALQGLVSAIQKALPDAIVDGFLSPQEALDFMKGNTCDIAFLDIEMRGINGIELAKILKIQSPKINIIFTTAYSDYASEAFGLHASGYIMKPITPEKIGLEVENLRYPTQENISRKKVTVHTFGNFEVYVEGMPAKFQYTKTKEMFAYLINRRGSLCTNNEIMAVLWEDDAKNSYYKNIRVDLLKALPDKIFSKQWGKIGVIPENISCDYYDWLNGEVSAINAYKGEYMAQYSWGESVLGNINANHE